MVPRRPTVCPSDTICISLIRSCISRIVTGSDDRIVKVVAAETGQVIYDTAFHNDWVRTVVFTSEFFISGSDDRQVTLQKKISCAE